MLRLPDFSYHQPTEVGEALALKRMAGDDGMYVAGGTDLYPNMKRRHQQPSTVISLARIEALHGIEERGSSVSIGAAVSLTELAQDERIRSSAPFLSRAAELVSTPLLRNMGTVGGNLCLDTRCNYYNQTYEWRKAIDFCMKKDGAICWVAPSSPRCWAVQSSDLAPVMVAIGAEYLLVGPEGQRSVPAATFYQNDGIAYLSKTPDEILTRVVLPPVDGTWNATYWKLRRRGSFDFPVLGVAAWIAWDGDTVRDGRIILGGVASYPQDIPEARTILTGSSLDDDVVARTAQAAFKPSKPMDNTDFHLAWRKEMTRHYVRSALEELRRLRQ